MAHPSQRESDVAKKPVDQICEQHRGGSGVEPQIHHRVDQDVHQQQVELAAPEEHLRELEVPIVEKDTRLFWGHHVGWNKKHLFKVVTISNHSTQRSVLEIIFDEA